MTEYKYDRYDEEHDEGSENKDFEEGEEVLVDPSLRLCSKGENVVDSMIRYAGKTAIITGKRRTHYFLDIDNGCFYWNDYMLMPAHPTPSPDPDIFQRLLQ